MPTFSSPEKAARYMAEQRARARAESGMGASGPQLGDAPQAEYPLDPTAGARERAARAVQYAREMADQGSAEAAAGGAYGNTAAALASVGSNRGRAATAAYMAGDQIVDADIARQLQNNQFNTGLEGQYDLAEYQGGMQEYLAKMDAALRAAIVNAQLREQWNQRAADFSMNAINKGANFANYTGKLTQLPDFWW